MGYASLTKCRNPNGWFQVLYSDEIALGEVKPLKFFERDLVIWRGHSGKIYIQDAHCLHLGAHRGVTGHVKDTVKGDNLQCPWHLWEWNGEGKVVAIPYSPGECKPGLKIRSYEVVEWCDRIMCWYHNEDQPPSWQLPEVWQYSHEDWYSSKSTRLLLKVKGHVQMPAENSTDFAHILPIHGRGITEYPTCTLIEEKGIQFRSIVEVPYGQGKKSTYLTPEGQANSAIDMNVYGIGASVIYWEKPWPTVQVSTFTNIDDQYFNYWFDQVSLRGPGEVGDELQGRAKDMARVQMNVIPEDQFIWENMMHLENANFSKAEAKMYPVYREWAQQFYPDTRPGWEKRRSASSRVPLETNAD